MYNAMNMRLHKHILAKLNTITAFWPLPPLDTPNVKYQLNTTPGRRLLAGALYAALASRTR
jgi:hypothetical protein